MSAQAASPALSGLQHHGHGIATSRKGKRACMECSRKKTKCDMKLPICSLCIKYDCPCTYPTHRKPRAPRTRSDHQILSASQESRDAVVYHNMENNLHNYGLVLQKDTQSPNFAGAAESLEAHPSDSHRSKSRKSARDGSDDADPDLINPLNTEPFADFDIHGMFGGFGLPMFGTDISSNFWQTSNNFSFAHAAVDEPLATNLDYLSHISDPPEGEISNSMLSGEQSQSGTGMPETASVGTSERVELRDEVPGLEIPPLLTRELIDLFFLKVHPFVPIFHRPRFVQAYSSIIDASSTHYGDFQQDELFILQTMFALSARFSSSPYFDGIQPSQRGDRFGEKAKAIYHDSIRNLREPTLHYLQGCILLAFFLYLSGPDSQGWLTIGMCTRLAYDLGLNKVDEIVDGQLRTVSPLEWSMKEELRRAWWSIWELDTFASAIVCRPHTIDRTKMYVKLPVADHKWFLNVPIESAIIEPNPLHAWHALRDCSNQDERAWFLLINYLLLIAHGLGQQKRLETQDIRDIENAVACYEMLLPSQFHLESDSIYFDGENFARMNWVICTNIMLQGCRIFIKFLGENSLTDGSSGNANKLLAPLAARFQFRVRPMDYRRYSEHVFRTIRIWSPGYIPYATPFIGCLLLGPAAINLRVAKISRGSVNEREESSNIEVDMLKLAISHIARFWKFGSLILDLANLVVEKDSLTRIT